METDDKQAEPTAQDPTDVDDKVVEAQEASTADCSNDDIAEDLVDQITAMENEERSVGLVEGYLEDVRTPTKPIGQHFEAPTVRGSQTSPKKKNGSRWWRRMKKRRLDRPPSNWVDLLGQKNRFML